MEKLKIMHLCSGVMPSICFAGNALLIVVFFVSSLHFATFVLGLIAWNISSWFLSLFVRALIYSHQNSPDWDEIVESGIICLDIAEMPKEIYQKIPRALVVEHLYDDTTVVARDTETNEKKRYAQVDKIVLPKEKEQKSLNGSHEEKKPLLGAKGKK